MTYDAVIFDNDGVLTTMTSHDRAHDATAATLRELEYDLESAAVREIDDTIGRSAESVEAFRAICESHGIDPAYFWRIRETILTEGILEALVTGEKRVHEDVDAIFDLDRRLAIVSNTQHRTLTKIVDHFSWERTFATYYGREPTLEGFTRMKPDPYYVEKTIADLGTENVLFVGDSSNDIGAARNVGIDSAFVRRPRKADLGLELQPTYEITDLEQLSSIV